MPNWTNNTLTVSCKTKDKDILKKFIETAKSYAGIVVHKKDLKAKQTELIEKDKESYRDRIQDYAKHKLMKPDKYLRDIKFFNFDNEGNIIEGYHTELSLGKFLPCPLELKKVTSPVRAENGETEKEFKKRIERHKKLYGATDWYDFQTNNWGTKWDVKAAIIVQDENAIVYSFDSAWSPPAQWIGNVAPMFPELRFELEYLGEGNEFKGIIEAQGDDYSDTPLEVEPEDEDY